MKPPKVIYVGTFDYDVEVKKLQTDLFGETDNTNSTISLHKKQSLANLRDTLMHEVLHAVFFASGICRLLGWDNETEEKAIRMLTPWLLQLIQENPALIEFLTAVEIG